MASTTYAPSLPSSLDELPEDLVLLAIDKSKESGDSSFRAGEWDSAVTHFTEALSGALQMEKRSSLVPSLFRNRASAHFAKKQYDESLKDAKASVKIQPQSSKGNYRVGRALFALSEFKDAKRYFGASLAHALKHRARLSNEKHIADIEKWKAKAQQAWEAQVVQEEAQALKKAQFKQDEALTKRAVRRHAIDYSRFDQLDDDDEEEEEGGNGSRKGGVKAGTAVGGGGGRGGLGNEEEESLVFEPTKEWKEMSRPTPFKRAEAEHLREALLKHFDATTSSIAGAAASSSASAPSASSSLSSPTTSSLPPVKITSSLLEAYTGLLALLSNLAVLQLPLRRLRQVPEVSLLQAWHKGIQHCHAQAAAKSALLATTTTVAAAATHPDPSSATNAAAAVATGGDGAEGSSGGGEVQWLVAGFGIGATAVAAAHVACQPAQSSGSHQSSSSSSSVTFVGVDCSQPSLLRVVRDTLLSSGVKVGVAGLGSLPANPTAAPPRAAGKAVAVETTTTTTTPSSLAGLSSIKKNVNGDKEEEGDEEEEVAPSPKVLLLRGTLETLELEPGASRFHRLALDPELFDAGLLGQRVLPSVRHAHKNLLVDASETAAAVVAAAAAVAVDTVMPRRAKIRGMVVELETTPDQEHIGGGVDLSLLRERGGWSHSYEEMNLAPPPPSPPPLPLGPSATPTPAAAAAAKNTTKAKQEEIAAAVEGKEDCCGNGGGGGGFVAWKALTEPFDVWDFHLADAGAMAALPEHDHKTLTLGATDSGRANAVITWIELDVGGVEGGGVVSSHPFNQAQRYWGQAVYWLEPPKPLCTNRVARKGQSFQVSCSRSDTAVKFAMAMKEAPPMTTAMAAAAANKSRGSSSSSSSSSGQRASSSGVTKGTNGGSGDNAVTAAGAEAAGVAAAVRLRSLCLGKAPVRAWELFGNQTLVAACRDSVAHSVRHMRSLRRHPRAGGVHVLELQCGGSGSGSGGGGGLLSMLASTAGASSLLACDSDPAAVEHCKAVAALNGLLSDPAASAYAGGLASSGAGAGAGAGAGSIRFSSKHPSELKCVGYTGGPSSSLLLEEDGGSGFLPRPVDLLLLPLPETGLLSGGLLKLLRAVQLNSHVLAKDALVFPTSFSIWAQVVELSGVVSLDAQDSGGGGGGGGGGGAAAAAAAAAAAGGGAGAGGEGSEGGQGGEGTPGGGCSCYVDSASSVTLLPPAALGSPPPINLAKTPHVALTEPALVATVDLANLLRKPSGVDPASFFQARTEEKVKVTCQGRATAVVWWWDMRLCRLDRPSLCLSNCPGRPGSPWATQDVEYIREAPGLDQGELLSLSMCPTQDALRLKWELTTEEEDGPLPWRQDPARLQSPLPKFDSQWAIAWGKLTKHQEKIQEAVAKDPMLFKQVMQVAECIALDPGSFPSHCEGVPINHTDASLLAASFRMGL